MAEEEEEVAYIDDNDLGAWGEPEEEK